MQRRAALCKFGLTAAVVYVYPTMFRLDRMARAVTPSCFGRAAKGVRFCNKGPKWAACRPVGICLYFGPTYTILFLLALLRRNKSDMAELTAKLYTRMRRLNAIARLRLVVAVAYTVPTILHLDR